MKPPTKSNNLYYIQWLVCTFGSCPNGLLHFLSHLWGQGLDLGRLILGRGHQRIHCPENRESMESMDPEFIKILPTNFWWFYYILLPCLRASKIWIYGIWWYSYIINYNNMIFSNHFQPISSDSSYVICLSQACSEVATPGPLSNLSANSWNEKPSKGQKKRLLPRCSVFVIYNIIYYYIYIYIYNIEYMDHFQGLRQDPSRNSMLNNRVALPWQLLTWNICWWLGN